MDNKQLLLNEFELLFLPIVKVKLLSRVRLFATPWTAAHQAPRSMEFSRQEYWSGLPFPSPGDLPDPRISFSPDLALHDATRTLLKSYLL